MKRKAGDLLRAVELFGCLVEEGFYRLGGLYHLRGIVVDNQK
jgi:hypothetical protein